MSSRNHWLAWTALALALPALASAQQMRAVQARPSGPLAPPAAYSAAGAFDAEREVLVVFGGFQPPAGDQGETWEWDGAWRRAAQDGPSPRNGPAMTYDAARRVVVLFGGNDRGGPKRDTWEWTGATWKFVSNVGPGRRTLSRIAFDAKRGTVLMFGGMTQSAVLAETWEWNGAVWTRLADGPPRHLHGFVPFGRLGFVTFGGSPEVLGGPPAPTGETWAFTDGAWHELEIDGPTPRDHIDMAYDVARRRAVTYGGAVAGEFSDETWEFDGRRWELMPAGEGPGLRSYPVMVYDSARERVLLYGGFDAAGPKNDLWAWDGRTWTLLAGGG